MAPIVTNRQLIKTLARFIPSSDIRRVITSAELDPGRIEISGHALNTWTSVFDEARKAGQIDQLLQAVRDEFPYPELQRTMAEWERASKSEQASHEVGSEDLDGPDSAKQLTASRRRHYERLVFERVLEGTGNELFSVAFSPNGSLVAAGSDGQVLIWERTKPAEPRTLGEHESYIYSVAFSHDGQRLATGGEDGWVKVWDVDSGELVWEHDRPPHDQAIYSVCFSPDDTLLASGSYDRLVKLWYAKTGDAKFNSYDTLGKTGRVSSLAFSPKGSILAIGRLDDTVTLWNIRTRSAHVLRKHTSSVETVAFSPDGKWLASGGLDKTIRLWNVSSRKQQWERKQAHEYLIRSVYFSPDGAILASASWDKTVRLWDVQTGDNIKALPFAEELPWHTDWIWSVTFSPEAGGLSLATGSSDGKIILWSIQED